MTKLTSRQKDVLDIKIAPIALLDYIWVIIIYFLATFWLAVLIDGYILPEFVLEYEESKSSLLLFVEVFIQFAVQGFIALMLHSLLSFIPSPFNGINGYNINNSLGVFLRNPAIISTMLLFLSNTLRRRMLILFSRYDINYANSLKKESEQETSSETASQTAQTTQTAQQTASQTAQQTASQTASQTTIAQQTESRTALSSNTLLANSGTELANTLSL